MNKIFTLFLFFALFTACRSENENEITPPIIEPPVTTIPKLISKITGQNGAYTKFTYENYKISELEIATYNPDNNLITIVNVSCEYQNEKISKIYRNNDLFAQLYYDNAGILNSITYTTNYSPENNSVKFTYQNNLLKSIIYPANSGNTMSFTYNSNEIIFESQWGKRGETSYDNKKSPLSTVDKNLIYGFYLCNPFSNPEFANYSNNILKLHLYYVNSNFNYTTNFTYEYDNEGYAVKKLNSSGATLETFEYK